MTYRGDEEASAERLRALDEEIAALEARLTDAFWEHVAPAWGVAEGLDAALDPLEARHARIAEVRALIERAESGRIAAPDLPTPASAPTGLLASVGRALALPPGEIVDGISAVVQGYAPDARLDRLGGSGWGARLVADGAPIELSYYPNRDSTRRFLTEIETTVAPSARLSVKPEGILQDLLDAVGIGAEIELGDSAFDPAFVVRGDDATARSFLTAEVRRALLVISERAPLEVEIAHGRARLRTHASNRRAIACALEVLVAWHAIPSPHALLQGE